MRLLRVDAGGFGVERKQLGVVQFFQPGIETRLIEDGFVGGFSSGGRCFGLWFAEQIVGRCRLGGSTQFQAFGVAIKVVQPALELQQAVQLVEFRRIFRAHLQVVEANVQRYVDLDGRQLIGKEGHFLVLFELGRQGLGTTNRQGRYDVELRIELGQAAVHTDQQTGSGLRTDTWNTRNVVGRIAHERQIIDDLLRSDAEFLLHALHVHAATGHGVDQGNVTIDQLRHILVARGDDYRTIRRRTAASQSANHVIGLDAFDAQQREAQGDHALVQRFDLHAHVVRHTRTVGLVFGVHVIAKSPALGVEHHGERTIRILLAQALEHVQHALDRTGRQAFGRGQRWQRVKGAVQVRRTVHQDEGGLAHEQDQPFRRVRR
ncbi:hypothetical protein D3C78_657360 [compost metagenome]